MALTLRLYGSNAVVSAEGVCSAWQQTQGRTLVPLSLWRCVPISRCQEVLKVLHYINPEIYYI